MPDQQNDEQKATVRRVMHEFKHGELESSQGGKVKNPKQAIAIALSEAGASNQQTPEQNRRQLGRSKRKERTGQTAQVEKEGRTRARWTLTEARGDAKTEKTRKELYIEARRRNITGRSRMSKMELARALQQ